MDWDEVAERTLPRRWHLGGKGCWLAVGLSVTGRPRERQGVVLCRDGDTSWSWGPLTPFPQHPPWARKLIWYTGGTLPTPLSRGVRSMSSGATGLATEKFWRMVMKKRNNSMRAMPSPRQLRFPVGTEYHQYGHGADAHPLPSHIPNPDICVHCNRFVWDWPLTCNSGWTFRGFLGPLKPGANI